MKRLFLSIAVLVYVVLQALPTWAQRSDNCHGLPDNASVRITETNLPIIFIEVNRKTILRNAYVPGRMKVIDNGPGQKNYGGDDLSQLPHNNIYIIRYADGTARKTYLK